MWEKVGLEPWRLFGVERPDLPTLEYWVQAYSEWANARAGAEDYVNGLPPKERQAWARSQRARREHPDAFTARSRFGR